jgi:hypothetical protein
MEAEQNGECLVFYVQSREENGDGLWQRTSLAR